MAQRFKLLLAVALMLLAALITTGYTVLASGPNQDSYPPPAETPAILPSVEASSPTPTLSPYPVEVERDFFPATPVPVGEQSVQSLSGAGDVVAGQTAREVSGRGLLYLWLGFLATFLIFVTSVIGATLLFTRRNES